MRTRSVAKLQRDAVMASVLMSDDILPLILDFLPRNEMRKVAMLCRFFISKAASHLQPIIFTFICHRHQIGLSTYQYHYTPLLYYPRSQTWHHVAAPRFSGQIAWTELNGFYYAIGDTTVSRYDPIDEAWTQLPRPRSARQEYGLAIIALENKLYLVGGTTGTLSCFDIQSKSWELVSSSLVKRSMCGAATLYGYIYAVGGAKGEYNGAIAHVERWRPDSNARSWEQVASLNEARRDFNICTIENRLYVFGGISESNAIMRSCEMYSPVTNEWTMIAAMPTQRYRFSHVVVGRLVYILGTVFSGQQSIHHGEETNLIEIYDTETNSWSTRDPIPPMVTDEEESAESEDMEE